MLRDMPLQNLQQRARFGSGGNHAQEWRPWRRCDGRSGLPGEFQSLPQVGHRTGLADQIDGQANAERAFKTHNQFGPAKAVDSEVAYEPTGQGNRVGFHVPRMKLASKLAHYGD